MNIPADPVVMLSRALDQADVVLTGVHDGQMGLSTPCSDWDVETVIGHLMRDLENFVAVATGGTPDWQAAGVPLTEHWLGDFRARSNDLLHAWHQAGSLEGTVELPAMGEVPARLPVDQQTTELAVHGWDVWKATGQDARLDDGVAQTALDLMQASLRPEVRESTPAFGPEVAVPEDAPVWDRLAAFSGRDPGWSPPDPT